MEQYGLTFHHLGLATSAVDKGRRFLQGLGYQLGEAIYDQQQKVFLVYGNHARMPTVELVYPGAEPGPLDRILSKNGDCLYHMCFSTLNVDSTLEKIKLDGIRLLCLSPFQPALLFQGREVAFYNVAGFGLLEILNLGEGL